MTDPIWMLERLLPGYDDQDAPLHVYEEREHWMERISRDALNDLRVLFQNGQITEDEFHKRVKNAAIWEEQRRVEHIKDPAMIQCWHCHHSAVEHGILGMPAVQMKGIKCRECACTEWLLIPQVQTNAPNH